tara:strand:- start:1808 stop:3970 length:2163 start_codon:yes stop_codon:yes gene_type:complete
MSYIITSNIDVNHANKDPNTISNGMNKAYSYTNSMDSMVIPENSEIAVASVKVNREGIFTASKDNNRFALYYGPPNTNTAAANLSDRTYMEELTQPIFGNIRGESGNATSTFNTDDFGTAVQESMRLFTFHPAYQKSDLNTSGLTVSASRVANEGFKGFNFTTNSYTKSLLATNACFLASPIIAINNGENDAPMGLLTPQVSITNLILSNKTSFDKAGIDPKTRAGANILGNRPLSLVGGVMTVDISNFDKGANGSTTDRIKEFEIGLTRAQKNYRVYDDTTTGTVSPFPPYFGPNEGDAGASNMGYYDYVVKNVQKAPGSATYEIRIYQAVCDNITDGVWSGAETRMVEVDYRSELAGNKRWEITDTPTGENIKSIEFQINNEEITIRMIDEEGDSDDMEIKSTNYPGSVNKSQRLKPVNTMCWNMYPKIRLPGWGGETETTNYSNVNITMYKGNLLENHQYGGLYKPSARPAYMTVKNDGIYDSMTDFYSYCLDSPLDTSAEFRLPLEDCVTKSINYHNANTNTVVPTQKGLTALSAFAGNKQFVDVSNVLIMGTTNLYPNGRGANANTKNILGFPNNAVVVGQFGPVGGYNPANPTEVRTNTSSASLLLSAYTSDSTPKLTSGESSFVRVRNLATQTFNVANQSFSKILYHIPKFDNSGTEVGSLFFEPGERMYIKLNNLTPLNLNNIDVDLVLGTEVVEASYTGTTVVCFHIQKSR